MIQEEPGIVRPIQRKIRIQPHPLRTPPRRRRSGPKHSCRVLWLLTVSLCEFRCVTVVEGLTEVEMGIDLATWRTRIGLNYCRQSRNACRPLPVQWRAARWGVGEVMNSTPLLLQGCVAVVSLSLILGYTFRRRPIGRCGCGRPKLRAASAPLGALVFMSQIVVYTIRLNIPFQLYTENEVTGFPYVVLKVLLVLEHNCFLYIYTHVVQN